METTVAGGNSAETSGASSPTTFAEAFASDASPAPEPSQQSTDATAAAQPTTAAESPQQPDERSPFIPRARFDDVNTERNTLKQWKEQHAWVETPEALEAVQRIARSQGNPMALLTELVRDLSPHPEYGPQLRSFFGQQFGALRQRQVQSPDPSAEALVPDVVIHNDQGQEVGRTYSAEKIAALKQQWLQEVRQSLEPDLRTVKTIQQERETAAMTEQANQFATSLVEEFKGIPGFDPKTHGPLLAAEIAMLQLPQNAHPAVVEAAARKALLKAVLPTLGHKAESALLDNLQRKAAANSSVNPGSAAPSTPRSITRFDQLPADAWK